MDEGFVELPSLSVFYRIIGAGEPIVFLHGGPGGTHDYFLPSMEPLARLFQLVFFDQRGCGKSRKPKPVRYTLDDMAYDLEGLCESLRLEKLNLFGHSFGGRLALQYVPKYPRRVKKLILADTFPSTEDANQRLHADKGLCPSRNQVHYRTSRSARNACEWRQKL